MGQAGGLHVMGRQQSTALLGRHPMEACHTGGRAEEEEGDMFQNLSFFPACCFCCQSLAIPVKQVLK